MSDPTDPGSPSPSAPPTPPPGSFPGQPIAPPSGSFPGQPAGRPAAPPPGGLPPYAAPASPAPRRRQRRQRRRRRALAVVGAVVAVGAAGAFALTQLGGSDGAGSPEAAVEAMFAAVGDEDLLGVLEALTPGERRALRPTVEDLADELERLEILGDGVALDGIDGIDIVVGDLALDTEPLGDGFAAVAVTSGSIAFESVPDDLPIGDNLRGLIEEGGAEIGRDEISDEGDLGEADVELVAVEADGAWHVSVFYSLAEAARRDAGLDRPDFGAGIEPVGADSAEDAVEGLLRSAVDLALEAVIAGLAPDEARALQDYAPLFLPDAEAGAADLRESGVEIVLDDLDLGTQSAGDGATRVTLDAFRLLVTMPDEGELAIDFDGECARVSIDGDDAVDVFGSDGEEVCIGGTGAGVLGSLTGATAGIVTVEDDGAHYVSPTRTAFDGVLGFIAGLEPEDLEDPEEILELVFGPFLEGAGGDGIVAEPDLPDDLDDPPDAAPGDAAPPDGLGDDPEFEALADDCFGGDFDACDDLYFVSPIGSDYERYAQTCGGRLAEQDIAYGDCALRLGGGSEPGDGGGATALDPTPPPPPEDPAFEPLVEACFGGDMDACDRAYIESGVGSPEEAYGLTCGGRRSESDALETCEDRFGATVTD